MALKESDRFCRDVTRRSATSFYYAFKTLPRRKRRAFEIIYAFMRLSDDLSDDASSEDRAKDLARWRDYLREAANGNTDVHPVMPALMSVVEEFEIPVEWLEELIDGTEQDLTVTRFADVDALYDYCYKVASIVGLVSLQVFGLEQPSEENWKTARERAIECGQAFQLTNILRDIKEDLERDRIYLPQDELGRFELTEDDLRNEVYDDRFTHFMTFQVDRAQDYYDRSAPLVDMVARDARPCLKTMRGVYAGILARIVEMRFDVWSARASVPLARKLGIAARAFLGRYGS